MRKLLMIASCFLSIGLLGASTVPDFQSLYDGYAAAVRAMNVDGYMEYFAGDFQVTSPDGREFGKEELAQAQRSVAPDLRVNGFKITVQSIELLPTGEYGVVVLQEFDRDQAVARGKSLRIQNSVVRREIWRATAAGWKIERIEEVLSSPTMTQVHDWL